MLSVSRLPKPMWAQACETAVCVLNRTGKTSVRNVEWSRDEEPGSSTCVWHSVMYTSQSNSGRNSTRMFGRMVGYLNDKDGYQVYVPSLNKIVHSHYVYFKPERVCTSSVVERGWKT